MSGKKEDQAEKKLNYYRKNQEHYENTNNEILDIENNYFSFLLFSGEFERAIILIGGIHNLQQRERNRGEDSLRESRSFNNTLQFEKNITVFIKELKEALDKSFDLLFNFREKVKKN